jgi:hypothetical protein
LATRGFDVTPNEKSTAFGSARGTLKTNEDWFGIAEPRWEGTVEGNTDTQCHLEDVTKVDSSIFADLSTLC